MRAIRQLIGLGLARDLPPVRPRARLRLYFGEAPLSRLPRTVFRCTPTTPTPSSPNITFWTKPELCSLHYTSNYADSRSGDFEPAIASPTRRAPIKAVLEEAVDLRRYENEAAFSSPAIHFQGQLDDALQALPRIKGTVLEENQGRPSSSCGRTSICATAQPSAAVKVLAQ